VCIKIQWCYREKGREKAREKRNVFSLNLNTVTVTINLSTTVFGSDACTVNAFKARLDKFWQHQLVKFDFTADLTGTGNRSEEVIK